MATIAEALDIAVRHHTGGNLAEAEAIYRQVLAVQPDNADALNLMGVIAHQVGRNDLAVDFLTRAIAAKPEFPEALSNLGNALKSLDRLDEAAAHYRRAIASRPGFTDAVYNLGATLEAMGRLDEAVAAYREAIDLTPHLTAAHYNLGNVLKDLGRLDQAIASYRTTLALAPDHADAVNNLGSCLHDLARFDEAVACYRSAIHLRPDFALPHANLGNALTEMGNVVGDGRLLDEAAECFRRAIALKPDHADAYVGLGSLLHVLNRPDEALVHLHTALELRPDSAQAYNNLGLVHKMMGRIDAALENYDRAVALKPDMADAYANRALALFVAGRLKEAWTDYEWRWRRRGRDKRRPFPQPWWDGQDLGGKELLVWNEQGLADEILGIGMLRDAMRLGGRCVVECDHRLVALFSRSFPAATFVPRRDPPDPRCLGADYQLPLFGLGRHTRNAAADFPADAPGLVPDPARAAYWKTWIDGLGPGAKVGLSWRGRLTNWERPLHFPSLDQMAILLGIPGLVFVNLQYDGFEDDIEEMKRLTGVTIHSPPNVDLTNDLDDVAALMAGLDAVVGPSTAVADLAGAVGRPTWLYAFHPVGNEKEICNFDHIPWCPAIRVEKRGFGEGWEDALTSIARDLRGLGRPPLRTAG